MVKENVFTIFVHDSEGGHDSRNFFQQLKGWTPDVVHTSGDGKTAEDVGADGEGAAQDREENWEEDPRLPTSTSRWLGR